MESVLKMNLSSIVTAADGVAKLELNTASGVNGPLYIANTWNDICFNNKVCDSDSIVNLLVDGSFEVTPGVYVVKVQFSPGQLVGSSSNMYFNARLSSIVGSSLLKWPTGVISQTGTILDHGKLDGVIHLTQRTQMNLEIFTNVNRTHQAILADGVSNVWWSIDLVRLKK